MPEIAFCVPAEPTGADSSRKDANTSSGLWPIRHRNDHASLRGLFREEPSTLIAKYGEKTRPWPPIFQFIRAIRNFISHSSGKVHFDYKNDPAVSWHHLRYSVKDEGRQVIGGDIDIAELIILLVEFGDALDRE